MPTLATGSNVVAMLNEETVSDRARVTLPWGEELSMTLTVKL